MLDDLSEGCAFAVMACIVLVLAVGLGGLIFVANGCNRVATEVFEVADQELGPQALLKKYTWFKDAAAMLEKKQADMKVYDKRLKGLEEAYKGEPRTKWARDDREQWSIWTSECAGIRASYNELAAQYNSAMAKENWRFCEIGRLPQGASTPLPREFKPYQED